jgi:hypothetical protein
MRRGILLLLFVLAAHLAACAPQVPDPGRVEVRQLAERLSYYPHQTGVVWSYLRDGERLDAAPVVQRVEGPVMLGGEVLVATRLVGRGLDTTYYRRYGPSGVQLVRETRPGAVIDYDPPIQELPSEGALHTGSSWGGTTTARLFFAEARAENQRAELRLDYRYSVVDHRAVSVAAGGFEVYVINLVAEQAGEGERGETVQQELWFAPFVGEVRTRTGYLLVDGNFAQNRP